MNQLPEILLKIYQIIMNSHRNYLDTLVGKNILSQFVSGVSSHQSNLRDIFQYTMDVEQKHLSFCYSLNLSIKSILSKW